MSYFNDQITEGLKTLKQIVGIKVTYTQNQNSVVVNAVVGSTTFGTDSNEGTGFQYKTRDYLIDVCELELNDVPIVPAKADTISETDGIKIYVYEVVRPDGEQCFSYSDPARTRYRIKTQLKEVQNL